MNLLTEVQSPITFPEPPRPVAMLFPLGYHAIERARWLAGGARIGIQQTKAGATTPNPSLALHKR
jgi:hypothetical protein